MKHLAIRSWRLERDSHRKVQSQLFVAFAVRDIDGKRTCQRAPPRAETNTNGGLELLERVGGVPHVDESGDAKITAPALEPVHIFDRGHRQRATADNRSTLADAEAFVVVSAHGGRAASAKQETSRHDVGRVGPNCSQLAPQDQHIALPDREILHDAPVASRGLDDATAARRWDVAAEATSS